MFKLNMHSNSFPLLFQAQCPRGKRRTTCSNCVATCKNPNPKCSIMRRQRKCIIGCSCSYPLVLHNKRCIRRNRCPGM